MSWEYFQPRINYFFRSVKNQWTANSFGLSSPQYTTMPTTTEALQHARAGLGKKRITFQDKASDHDSLVATLYIENPKLAATEGASCLYKAVSGGSGNRFLSQISPGIGPVQYAVRYLRENCSIGNSIIYVKLLQAELSLENETYSGEKLPSFPCKHCKERSQ